MKRLIHRPWFVVATLAAACVAASASLGRSFGYQDLNDGGARSLAGSKGDAGKGASQDELPASAAMLMMGMTASNLEEENPELADEYQAPSRLELASEELMYATSETRKLIKAYHQTDDREAKAAIVKELPDAVAKEFDFRQELRKVELEELEQQLRTLQELHQRRAKQRGQIIEQRVRQLLQDAEGLGWGSDEEHQPSTASGSARYPSAEYNRPFRDGSPPRVWNHIPTKD